MLTMVWKGLGWTYSHSFEVVDGTWRPPLLSEEECEATDGRVLVWPTFQTSRPPVGVSVKVTDELSGRSSHGGFL